MYEFLCYESWASGSHKEFLARSGYPPKFIQALKYGFYMSIHRETNQPNNTTNAIIQPWDPVEIMFIKEEPRSLGLEHCSALIPMAPLSVPS